MTWTEHCIQHGAQRPPVVRSAAGVQGAIASPFRWTGLPGAPSHNVCWLLHCDPSPLCLPPPPPPCWLPPCSVDIPIHCCESLQFSHTFRHPVCVCVHATTHQLKPKCVLADRHWLPLILAPGCYSTLSVRVHHVIEAAVQMQSTHLPSKQAAGWSVAQRFE